MSVAPAPGGPAPALPAAALLAAYDAGIDACHPTRAVQFSHRRAARRFLERHPDPRVWMRRSTTARLTDLHRLKAWPFLSWCFVQGHLVPDLELLLAKPQG